MPQGDLTGLYSNPEGHNSPAGPVLYLPGSGTPEHLRWHLVMHFRKVLHNSSDLQARSDIRCFSKYRQVPEEMSELCWGCGLRTLPKSEIKEECFSLPAGIRGLFVLVS